MKSESKLVIGLPDGKHIRKATWKLLTQAGISILEYADDSGVRTYKSLFRLPSGNECTVIRDRSRDVIYGLLNEKHDLIITGRDFMEDFLLHLENIVNSMPRWNKSNLKSAHIDLEHLGYFNTRLAFMTGKENPYNSIDDMIRNDEILVCYTEFPMIASKLLSDSGMYKEKYGNAQPLKISNFSINGDNKNVIIIYSNGASESKAVTDTWVLVLDLVLTGKTVEDNDLKILSYVGEPIFTLIYKRANLGEKEKPAKEFVSLVEKAVMKNPDNYVVKRKGY